eukprot:6193726-Pleurochrysis_carterae.AAC.2
MQSRTMRSCGGVSPSPAGGASSRCCLTSRGKGAFHACDLKSDTGSQSSGVAPAASGLSRSTRCVSDGSAGWAAAAAAAALLSAARVNAPNRSRITASVVLSTSLRASASRRSSSW